MTEDPEAPKPWTIEDFIRALVEAQSDPTPGLLPWEEHPEQRRPETM